MSAASFYFVKNFLISSIVRLSPPYSPPLALSFPLSKGFLSVARDIPLPLPEPTLIAQRFPISLPQPPDYQSPVSRVEAVPLFPLHRQLIHHIDLPVCFSDILPHSQFVSFIFEVRPPLRAFVCLLNIPAYLSFAIRFLMSPGLLPRFAHHPYPCLLFICRLTIYLPLACRTAHLLPRPPVSRAAVCCDTTSSSFAVRFHLISPFLDPFALLFAPIDPPFSVASICCRSCPDPYLSAPARARSVA